jgi:DNA-binding IclR family transcriptional regulator
MEEASKSSALSKAIAVLEAMASVGRPIAAAEIGLLVGQNRQTVHRVLSQLEALAMVQRDMLAERYRLGTRFGSLAIVGLGAMARQTQAHRVLEALVDEVRETSNVGVLDGHEVVYLDRVECDWPLRMHLQAGSRLPAYCTAIGKLLLAALPPEQLEDYLREVPLVRLTPGTITRPAALRRALGQIKAQGYSINDQEDHLGLLAIAVPLRTADGQVVAGLALHGPQARLTRQRAVELLPRLQVAAAILSGHLFGAEGKSARGKR